MPRAKRLYYLLILAVVVLWVVGGIFKRTWNPWNWIVPKVRGFTILRSSQTWGRTQIGRDANGSLLSVNGRILLSAIGTHARSELVIQVSAPYAYMTGRCGLNDTARIHGSIVCIIRDGQNELFRSGVLRGKHRNEPFKVPVSDSRQLTLIVGGTKDGFTLDHAAWFDITFEGAR